MIKLQNKQMMKKINNKQMKLKVNKSIQGKFRKNKFFILFNFY